MEAVSLACFVFTVIAGISLCYVSPSLVCVIGNVEYHFVCG